MNCVFMNIVTYHSSVAARNAQRQWQTAVCYRHSTQQSYCSGLKLLGSLDAHCNASQVDIRYIKIDKVPEISEILTRNVSNEISRKFTVHHARMTPPRQVAQCLRSTAAHISAAAVCCSWIACSTTSTDAVHDYLGAVLTPQAVDQQWAQYLASVQ
jgi:hypothetical protein